VECDTDSQSKGERYGRIHVRSTVVPEYTDKRRHREEAGQSCLEEHRVRCGVCGRRRHTGGTVSQVEATVLTVPINARQTLDTDQQKSGKELGTDVTPKVTTEYLHKIHSLHVQ